KRYLELFSFLFFVQVVKMSLKAPSQRQLRVGEEIRHVLAGIFMRGEFYDKDINNTPITVSEVRVSPDLKNANAYVMPLGGLNKDLVIPALSRNAPYLRKLVSDKMKLRYAPRISFRLDDSFEEAERINTLLNNPRVAKDLVKEDES
ncbi:MAG: 30S ribosome-binding factor RbfA, partial [Pseudomonadota bacterium]